MKKKILKSFNIESSCKSYFSDNINEIEKKQLTIMTPLYLTINKNNIKIVQLLVEHKN